MMGTIGLAIDGVAATEEEVWSGRIADWPTAGVVGEREDVATLGDGDVRVGYIEPREGNGRNALC